MDLENKPNKQGNRIGGGYMVVVYDNKQCVARGGNWWIGWWTADGITMQRLRD